MTARFPIYKKSLGFTLVELVITIVVVGVVFLGISSFLQLGVQSYVDTADRQRLQTQAQFVMEKMSRELRHAVPNSFQVNLDGFVGGEIGSCLQFTPIHYAGFYLGFPAADATQMNIAMMQTVISGATPTWEADLNEGDRNLVINPTRVNDLSDPSANQFVSVTGVVSGSVNTTNNSGIVRFPAPASGATPFTSESVAQRFYIYQDSAQYCLTVSNRLFRMEGAVLSQVAENIDGSLSAAHQAFVVDSPSLTRGALVHLNFNFFNDDEVSQFRHDVQVINVP